MHKTQHKYLHFFIYKLLLPLLYLAGWVFLYQLPRGLYYKDGGLASPASMLIALMLFVLPFLAYIIFSGNAYPRRRAKELAFGSLFLSIPFMLLIKYQDTSRFYVERETVRGIISKAELVPRYKKQDVWSVKAKYKVRGRFYETSFRADPKRTLSRGDTVWIDYTPKTPENSKIRGLASDF